MYRKVELFLRQGIIKKQAVFHNDEENQEYGEILIYNPWDKVDQQPMSIFTHPRHSFTIKGPGPDIGTEVYFFAFPYDYILPWKSRPGETDAMLAVNVSDRLPFLSPKPGYILLKRHPCGTLLTIEPEEVQSWNHFLINDYGELTVLHTQQLYPFKPWTKIVLNKPTSSSATSAKKQPAGKEIGKGEIPFFERKRTAGSSEKEENSKHKGLESLSQPAVEVADPLSILHINLDLDSLEAYLDPAWIWNFR